MTLGISHMIHVCVVCSNFERSLDFYTRLLGAKIAGKIGNDHGMLGVAMASPGADAWRGCFLYWGDRNRTSYIDLIEYLGAGSGGNVSRNGNDLGLSRIALRVADIEATRAELDKLGIAVVGPTVEFEVVGRKRRLLFIRDPDNTLIELVERVGPPESCAIA